MVPATGKPHITSVVSQITFCVIDTLLVLGSPEGAFDASFAKPLSQEELCVASLVYKRQRERYMLLPCCSSSSLGQDCFVSGKKVLVYNMQIHMYPYIFIYRYMNTYT